MNMVQFDTLEYAKKLKSSGVSDEHAEAMTEAMSEALTSKDIATKRDLKELEVSLTIKIKDIESSTKLSMEKLRGEMIKWTAGSSIRVHHSSYQTSLI